MELSVVIPVFNEAANIRPLVEEIRDSLDARLDYEVIFVDDASTDGTLGALTAVRTDWVAPRVLRHTFNAGQSAAIATGVRAARARWIATLDGDGQNDPADIPRLIAARDQLREKRSVMVAGWRQRREDSRLRRVSSRVANGVRGHLLGDETPDTGCSLKLFERELFLALPHFDHMHRFLPALARIAGARVVTVPVGHRPRRFGESKYGLFDRLWVGIVDLLGVLWLKRRSCRASFEEVLP